MEDSRNREQWQAGVDHACAAVPPESVAAVGECGGPPAEPAGGPEAGRIGGGTRSGRRPKSGQEDLPEWWHPAESANRPGANRQGGEDTIDFGWLVHWDQGRLAELGKRLDACQKSAQGIELAGSFVDLPGGIRGQVRPAGRRVGDVYYKYVIVANGMEVSLMDRPEPFGETPNVLIHIGATPLMLLGPEESYKRIRGMIEACGATIQREKVSRVDACLDLPGVGVEEFVRSVWDLRYVRRAKRADFHRDGLTLTGVTVGRASPILLRIYDKVAECKGSLKWDYMLACRYEGEEPTEATRIEYQIRRRVLKELGIETLADWLNKRANILEYLTSEWFRLTDVPVDRANSQRFGPSELWQTVAQGFLAWAGSVWDKAKRVRRRALDVSQLKAQALGCFSSVAGVLGESLRTFDDYRTFVEGCLSDVQQYGDTNRLLKKARAKRQAFEASMCFA